MAGRSCDSRLSGMSGMSGMGGISGTSSRMDELSNVRKELEEALRQVKDEMMAGGATRSEVASVLSSRSGRSRSSRSRCSSIASSRSESVASSRYSSAGSRPPTASSRKPLTSRPSTSASKKAEKKKQKPLVSRPTIIKRPSLEPCPTPGAFKPKQFATMNREDFVPLTLPLKGENQNQGPTRGKTGKPEGSNPFTKYAANQSSASALLSSKVPN